ncbi:class I SAM-dependent methyltransferase [Streptomyces marokkonensis]|uniref:Class I SAM-dependent methyltransferase n=1 Tax=Streptomyces marokkonensis TaxID=324855 RepID=A0ABW6Q076_9ACTN
MTSPHRSPAEAVAGLYDSLSELPAHVCDGNLHFGYWTDARDTSTFQAATEHLTALMVERLAPRTGQRVLDIGCGTGQPAFHLASGHTVEVLGVSVSRRQIEHASVRARAVRLADRVRFERADAQYLPYPDASFDAGWFFESLIHIPDKPRALHEAARVLRPGARLAIADMFHEPGRDWSAPRPLVTAVPLDAYAPLLADGGFEVLDLTDVTPHIRVPEPVRRRLRSMMRRNRSEWVDIVGEEAVEALLGPEGDIFHTPGLGYVLITARRR